MLHWGELLKQGALALGKDLEQAPKYKSYMKEVGFEEVVHRRIDWPLGPWAVGTKEKTMGIFLKEDLMGVLEGISMGLLGRGLGMSTEEIQVLLVQVRRDIENGALHGYTPW